MEEKDIAGIVILLVCCWGSAALFCIIGVWARRRKTPMHFWAGTEIDPDTITDIPAYNRENARMWERYSIFYWVSGVLGFLGTWQTWLSVLCVVVLLLASTVGILLLVREYRRISKKFAASSAKPDETL